MTNMKMFSSEPSLHERVLKLEAELERLKRRLAKLERAKEK